MALGSKCLDGEFFAGFVDADELNVVTPQNKQNLCILFGDIAGRGEDHTANDEAAHLICNVKTELDRIQGLVSSCTITALKVFLPRQQSLNTEKDLSRALFQCRAAFMLGKGGMIKVQPTSVMRRRPGMTRGCQRVVACRPTSKSSKHSQKATTSPCQEH